MLSEYIRESFRSAVFHSQFINMLSSLILLLISFMILDIEQAVCEGAPQVLVFVGSTANFSFQLQGDPEGNRVFIGKSLINPIMIVSSTSVILRDQRANFTGNISEKQITFMLRNVTLNDAGRYFAAITGGIPILGAQTLVVKASPTKPNIVELDIAESGSNYHLNCSTMSNSAPPEHGLAMMSEWMMSSTVISPGERYIVQGTELTITNLSYFQDNGARITCFAYEDQLAKSNESDALIIDVKYGPDNIHLSQFHVITVKETHQIIVNCTADCKPLCSFQWRKEQVSGSSMINQVLIINNVSKNDAGRYICTVNNTFTGRSKSVQTTVIVIYGPTSGQVLLSPSNSSLEIEENTAVNINCSTDCYPFCNYTWTDPQGFSQDGAHFSQVLDRTKDGIYTCTAINQKNTGKTASASVAVKVFFGPGSTINLGSLSSILGVNLHQQAPTIICNATCNPSCNYLWYKEGTIYNTGATLSVGMVEKSTRGNYTCQAYNSFLDSNRSSFTSVSITVFYGAGIVNLSAQDSNIVNENSSASFQCLVDSSPLPNITWRRVDNNTVLMTESGLVQSQFRIESAQCLDIGNYSCTADNGMWTPASDTLQFFVRCHPRTDFRIPLQTRIYGKRHTAVVLRYSVISYPLPNFTWTFIGNGSENSDLPSSVSQHNNGYQSELRFISLDFEEFGNYSVTADNSVSPSAKEVFEIISADVPEVPSNVAVIDLTPISVTIQWVAGYNGGPEQTFNIVVSAGEFTMNVTASDPGYRKIGTAVLGGLLPKTKYTIYIIARNSVGPSNRTEGIVFVTPEESRPVPISVVSIAVVAGGIGAGVVVFVLAAIAIILWRRYHHPRQHTDEDQLNKDLEERGSKESGLVDNPVYDSSGPHPGISFNNSAMGAEYPKVVKPKKKAEDPSELYAQVDKKGNKGGARGIGKKASKGDIYENNMLSGQKSNPETVYTNSKNVKTGASGESLYEDAVASSSNIPMLFRASKDDPLYADLMLDPPTTKNGRPVIRGIENYVEYAEIAFGKRGELLPDNDDGNEKTN